MAAVLNAVKNGNVSKVNGELNLPTFNRLGFGKITTINGLDSEKYVATVGKLAEKSTGNDSTTGHWEIAGLISESEFNIFPIALSTLFKAV